MFLFFKGKLFTCSPTGNIHVCILVYMRLCPSPAARTQWGLVRVTRDQKKNVIFINKTGSSLWKKTCHIKKHKNKQNTYIECHGAVSELNGKFLPFEQVSCLRWKHFLYVFFKTTLTEMAQPLDLQAFTWTAGLSQNLTCVLPVTPAQVNSWGDI